MSQDTQILIAEPRTKFYNENGYIVDALSDQEMCDSLRFQTGQLVALLTDPSFSVFENHTLTLQITMDLYCSFKLARSNYKRSSYISSVLENTPCIGILYSFYEKLLQEQLTFEHFTLLLALCFLIPSMCEFSDKDSDEMQQHLITGIQLLLTSVEPEYITDAMQILMPPAYLTHLFTMTMAEDIAKLKVLAESNPSIAPALRLISDVTFSKYGKYYMIDYSDELVTAYNTKNFLAAGEVLWDAIIAGDGNIITSFGKSHIIKNLKLQWGIIRELKVLAADSSVNTLLVSSNVVHFDYAVAMYCRLFALAVTLDGMYSSANVTGPIAAFHANTMTQIYEEMNEYLERLSTALIQDYQLIYTDCSSPLDSDARPEVIKSAKTTILLGSYCMALIKKILIGPMGRIEICSISPIVERFVSTCDYSYLTERPELPNFFCSSLIKCERYLYESYSFLMSLETTLKRFLNGAYEVDKHDPVSIVAVVVSVFAAAVAVLVAVSVVSISIREAKFIL